MSHANIKRKAPGAINTKGLHTHTNSADFRSHGPIQQAHEVNTFIRWLTAIYTCIKSAASGIYIDRAIGADTIVLAVLMAIYVIWRAA